MRASLAALGLLSGWFELTCARFWTNAKLGILEDERDLALDIYPGFALLGEF